MKEGGGCNSPKVSLSAHCDLLFFVGSTPHPYGGPTPQTIADRAARRIQFTCKSVEDPPTMTVSYEDSDLWPPSFVSTSTAGVAKPSFPLSGVELAGRAFRENFETPVVDSDSALPHQLERDRNENSSHCHPSHDEYCSTHDVLQSDSSCIPLGFAPPDTGYVNALASTGSNTVTAEEIAKGAMNESIFVFNPSAVRRALLQTLLVLHFPDRSPAVSFALCAHDSSASGDTSFFVLPRSAEGLMSLAHPVRVTLSSSMTEDYTLQCYFFRHSHDNDEQQRHQPEVVENEWGKNEARGAAAPLPSLLWCLDGAVDREEEREAESIELDSFLTRRMIPVLFVPPTQLLQLSTGGNERSSQLFGWYQRRSFHCLALIAHCIWCEKVSWFIMNSISTETVSCGRFKAQLKPRSIASLDLGDKWETTLLLFFTVFNGVYAKKQCISPAGEGLTSRPCATLKIVVRGCDEQLNWVWTGSSTTTAGTVVQVLNEMEDLGVIMTREHTK